jgi:hypothetical protein
VEFYFRFLGFDAMQCCRDLPPVSCCLHSVVDMVLKLLDIGKSLPEGSNPHNQCREHIKSHKIFEDLCVFAPLRPMFKFFIYSESLDVFSNRPWSLTLQVDVF